MELVQLVTWIWHPPPPPPPPPPVPPPPPPPSNDGRAPARRLHRRRGLQGRCARLPRPIAVCVPRPDIADDIQVVLHAAPWAARAHQGGPLGSGGLLPPDQPRRKRRHRSARHRQVLVPRQRAVAHRFLLQEDAGALPRCYRARGVARAPTANTVTSTRWPGSACPSVPSGAA